MFSNLNWTNVAILLLVALFVFGDKLPQIVADGLRLLRNLRRMATNATTDLSRELGTDIRVEDLHPKAFLRKHILSETDQEALLKPLKGVSDEVVAQAKGVERDIRQVGRDTEEAAQGVSGAAGKRTGGRVTRTGRRGAGADARKAAPAVDSAAADSDPVAPAASTTPLPRPAASSYDDLP